MLLRWRRFAISCLGIAQPRGRRRTNGYRQVPNQSDHKARTKSGTLTRGLPCGTRLTFGLDSGEGFKELLLNLQNNGSQITEPSPSQALVLQHDRAIFFKTQVT